VRTVFDTIGVTQSKAVQSISPSSKFSRYSSLAFRDLSMSKSVVVVVVVCLSFSKMIRISVGIGLDIGG